MQAIILAAGMGKRLGELTKENTKCMVKVNGITLIDRVLSTLKGLMFKKVIIVIGYEGEKLREYIGDRFSPMEIIYIENNVYYKTNNIYSLYLAREYMEKEDTLLLESDLIFDKNVVTKLLCNPYPDLALVDKYESWMDGTVVTIDEHSQIKSFIGKNQFDYRDINKYYKTVNIYKFSKEFAATHYVPFLEAYCKALGNNEYYEQVLRVITFLDNPIIKALPLEGEKWYEIDDIQDLDIAESLFARNNNEQWTSYTLRYGGYWRYPKMLDYCYLVNPFFPPDRMINEMKSNFEILLREYPSGMNVNSTLAAKYFDVRKEYIVVGNGAAELIKAFMENYAGTIGISFPTFEEYPNRLNSEKIIRYIPPKDGFRYTLNEYIEYFKDKPINSLLLINPDNPSGNYIPYNDLLKLISWTKEKGITLLIDESFVDFVDVDKEFSLLSNQIIEKNSHLVVIKSISKSYGVPGIRLGVLVSSNIQLIEQIKKIVSIWNINSFGEFYMQIFGKYEQDYIFACKQFAEERKLFFKELSTVSFLRIFPSQANYFLCEVIEGISSKELSKWLLSEYNILIKDCSNKNAFERKQYIRLAIRNRADNNHLVEVLNKYQSKAT